MLTFFGDCKMKIKIANIEPNPERKGLPIDKRRVDMLVGSIKAHGFDSGGLLCRKHPAKPDKYQLVWGHHRLQALIKLGWTELDVSKHIGIRKIDDWNLPRALADDNRNYMKDTPSMQTSTVKIIKDLLDTELAKYKTWEDLDDKFISQIGIESAGAFRNIKRDGVGRASILKYLNTDRKQGLWDANEIQLGIKILKESEAGTLDRKAAESFPKPYQTTEFIKAVTKAKIPVKMQKKVAAEVKKAVNKPVKKGEIKGGRAIEEEVYKHSPLPDVRPKPKKTKPLPMLDEAVEEVCVEMGKLESKLVQIEREFDSIQEDLNRASLYLRAKALNTVLTKILQRKKK